MQYNTNELEQVIAGMQRTYTDQELIAWLKSLDMEPDDKALLFDLKRVTKKIGNRVLQVGAFVLECVCSACKRFPNATTGVIIGLAIWWMLALVPVLGQLIAPVVGPLLVLAGGAIGAMSDIGMNVRDFLDATMSQAQKIQRLAAAAA